MHRTNFFRTGPVVDTNFLLEPPNGQLALLLGEPESRARKVGKEKES